MLWILCVWWYRNRKFQKLLFPVCMCYGVYWNEVGESFCCQQIHIFIIDIKMNLVTFKFYTDKSINEIVFSVFITYHCKVRWHFPVTDKWVYCKLYAKWHSNIHVILDSHQCFLLYCILPCIVKQNTALWDNYLSFNLFLLWWLWHVICHVWTYYTAWFTCWLDYCCFFHFLKQTSLHCILILLKSDGYML